MSLIQSSPHKELSDMQTIKERRTIRNWSRAGNIASIAGQCRKGRNVVSDNVTISAGDSLEIMLLMKMINKSHNVRTFVFSLF